MVVMQEPDSTVPSDLSVRQLVAIGVAWPSCRETVTETGLVHYDCCFARHAWWDLVSVFVQDFANGICVEAETLA